MQAHHCTSEGALYSLEEAIGDKDKQMNQLREQRDRAEKDKEEERDLHEREITEYKLKLHALECDIDKLNSRLDRTMTEKERLETRLESSQSELGKSKAELDKAATEVGRSCSDWESNKQRMARLELENERLRHELERSQVNYVIILSLSRFSLLLHVHCSLSNFVCSFGFFSPSSTLFLCTDNIWPINIEYLTRIGSCTRASR